MAKLHELLAVEGQLKGQAQSTRTELAATFKGKRHLFEEKVITFQPNEENAKEVREQQSDLQSQVRAELRWIAGIWSKAIDVSYAVAESNTAARADVVLEDGRVLLASVPATALLELEKRAAEIAELIKAVPTLDPAKGFTPDPARGVGIYRARDVQKTRTKKDVRVIVGAQATKEHPAQVQYVNIDVPTGTVLEQEWSGLITPAEKAELLERAEHFGRAVKQARQRANEQTVPAADVIGEKIFDYVFGD